MDPYEEEIFFLVQWCNKIFPRGDGPFQVIECINDNAYKLDLPGKYGVHATFSIANLSPFNADDELDLGTNHFQEEGNDERSKGFKAGRDSIDQVVQVPSGPITRVCVGKLRESLQVLICTIQDLVGDDTRTIEGVQLKELPCVTLFVVTHEALEAS